MKTISVVSLGLASLLGIAATALAAEPAPKAEAPKADAAKAEPRAPSPEAVAAGKKIDWSTMDEKAKKKYMKTTVLPTMKKLFVAVDKKHYAAMNCATCHGKKAVESNKLKMPSAELPKLPGPTNRAGFMALQEKKPESRSSWVPRSSRRWPRCSARPSGRRPTPTASAATAATPRTRPPRRHRRPRRRPRASLGQFPLPRPGKPAARARPRGACRQGLVTGLACGDGRR